MVCHSSSLRSDCRRFSSLSLLPAFLCLLATLAAVPAARAAAQPDLIAKDINTVASATLGTTFTLTLTVQNAGTASAPACTNNIRASVDDAVNSSDQLLTTFNTPALAAHTSTTLKLVIDTRRVGANKDQELAPGTYYLGAELDPLNQVIGEISESNVFVSSKTLLVVAAPPKAFDANGFYPQPHSHGTYVSRTLNWSTVTNASRYDLHLARLQDTEMRFIRHSLLNDITTATPRLYFAPLHHDLDYYYHPTNSYSTVYPAPSAYYYSRTVPYQDPSHYPINGNDLLVPQNNALLYYERVAEMPEDLANPHYFRPRTLITFTTVSSSSVNYGSSRYNYGTISAVCPVNLNYVQVKDIMNQSDNPDYMTDLVVANYMDEGDDQTTTTATSGGSVVVMLNLPIIASSWSEMSTVTLMTSGTTVTTGTTYKQNYARPSPQELKFYPMKLPNNRKIKGEGIAYVYGIKSLAVADFDGDGDYDVMAGGDQDSTGRDIYKLVVWQNSLRNNPQYKSDGKTVFYSETPPTTSTLKGVEYDTTNLPTFKPNGLNPGITDFQDMMIGDFNKDNMMDVAAVSFFGNGVYIMQNTTQKPKDVRTTATLGFKVVGPLYANEDLTTTTFLGASSVYTTDFNKDGKPDLVASSYFQGSILAYENTWNKNTSTSLVASNFVPHLVTNSFPNIEKVVAQDMNGDGYPDIIATSAANDRISWFENVGGTFKFIEHPISTNENRAGALGVSDMNGDLLPDVVCISQFDHTASWYANFPTLTGKNLAAANLVKPEFKPASLLNFDTTYLWQVTAKSNNYTTLSKVMTFRTQSTRVVGEAWPANSVIEPKAGANMYATAKNVGPVEASQVAFSVYIDPYLDRPFNRRNTGMYSFGTFRQARNMPSGASAQVYEAFDATDFPEGLYNFWVTCTMYLPEPRDGVTYDNDPDGLPDTIDTSPQTKYYWASTDSVLGPEAFLGTQKLAIIYNPDVPRSPAPASGAVDIKTGTSLSWVMDHKYANYYDVLMAKASLTAPNYTSITVTRNATGIQSFDIGDLTGDGKLDLVGSASANGVGSITWYKNRGDGRSFIASAPLVSNLPGAALVQIADMDHDGLKDILAASAANSQLWWYKNLGQDPPVFSQRMISTSLAGVNSIRAADLNNNNVMDVLVASSGDKKLCWFDGTGGTYHVLDDSHGPAVCAIPADINGDGLLDVVAAFWGTPNNTVAWYANLGGGQFSQAQVLPLTIKYPQWLAAADLNSDGSTDIVCLSNTGGLYWFANKGGNVQIPAFTGQQITAATGLKCLAIADYNHDARPDIITATTNGNNLVYYANGGGSKPVFTPYTVSSFSPGSIACVNAADFDGDNYAEVFGAANNGLAAWFDYQLNFQFSSTLATNGTTTGTVYRPTPVLAPSMGYQWQVKARRVIPLVGGGTLERDTLSPIWNLFTGQSDLMVQKASFTPASIFPGDSVTVNVTLTNNGLSDAAAQNTGIWISPDSTITGSGNDLFLGWITFPGIPSKGTVTQSATFSTASLGLFFLDYLPHYYYVGVIADAQGLNNSESYKENNKLVLPKRLAIRQRNAAQQWGGYR